MITACIQCQIRFDRPFSWSQLIAGQLFRTVWHAPLDHWLCSTCVEQVSIIHTLQCPRCGRTDQAAEPQAAEPNESFADHGNGLRVEDAVGETDEHGLRCCRDCERWLAWEQNHTDGQILMLNRSLLPYHSTLAPVFEQYKFRGDTRLQYFFASLLIHHFPLIPCLRAWNIDYIIPIPLTESRKQERGFNQAERIAKLLAEYSGIPLCTTVLQRKQGASRQSQLSRAQRLQEMLEKFIKNSGGNDDILNKNILIVDDVYTTGATVHAAAYHVKQLGANRVYSMTIFR